MDWFKEWLIDEGYNFLYGVCFLCCVVMWLLEDSLFEEVFLGCLKLGDIVVVDVDGDGKV